MWIILCDEMVIKGEMKPDEGCLIVQAKKRGIERDPFELCIVVQIRCVFHMLVLLFPHINK